MRVAVREARRVEDQRREMKSQLAAMRSQMADLVYAQSESAEGE